MKGVSEVIAIILILMITISLAGLAYMFMSTTMSDVTSSAGSTIDTTTLSMLTSFTIESIDVAKVYVRNTGQNALTGISVYVNDEMATFNVTPTSIATGAVGTVTIYSFIPDGATVKVTSPNGFSTSKVAQPCEKAIGCWKFDESNEPYAFDSSNNGNTGTLVNSPTRTNGKYNGAIGFDGSNDHIIFSDSQSLSPSSGLTISSLVYTASHFGSWTIVGKENAFQNQLITNNRIENSVYCQGTGWFQYTTDAAPLIPGSWNYVVITFNGTKQKTYANGVLIQEWNTACSINDASSTMFIGSWGGGSEFFNGTIDEVRLYNRAIY